MERPKHRWHILAGLALLACGALLIGHQWFIHAGPPRVVAATATRQLVAPQPDHVQPPAVAATAAHAASASPSPVITTGVFRGRVIDAATRKPVPQQFEVRLARIQRGPEIREEQPITQTFQSDTGRFAWKDAPAGTWNVTVAASRYQHFRVEGFSVVAGKTTREIVMPLQRGNTLRGRVFDQVSGIGIGEAWITFKDASAWRGQRPDEERFAKSKDDGTFVLDGVPGGDMIVSAGATGHAYREVAVAVIDDTPPLEIGLTTGGKIAGMVVAPNGIPVKGMVMLDGPGIGFFSEADETGRFSFEQRPAGRYQLRATTPAGSAKQEFELGENEIREDVVLQVAQGRSVRGTIKGLQPEQLSQTFLSLQPESRSAYFSTKPDEQGAYALNGLPAGRATLTAHAGMSHQLSRTVDVPADKDVALDIVFVPGARLSGRVTQAGKPASPRMVWMGPANSRGDTLYRARTAEDGRYEIEAIPPGEYRVRAEDDVSRVVTIAADTVLNIDIPLLQIGGRVLEDGSGATPIVGAEVYVRGTDTATERVHGFRETDHFGHFTMTGVEPGEVLLTVYKPGYELYRERITYGTPIANKKITLRQGGGVEIRVHKPTDGEPVHGFLVTEKSRGNGWDLDLWIPVDSEGIGHLPSALAGSTLEIQGSGDKPIVIREWDGQSLDLKL